MFHPPSGSERLRLLCLTCVSASSWTELLPLLEDKYGADKCYKFENNVFPNTLMHPPSAPQTLPPPVPSWHNVVGVNILSHLYHEPVDKNLRHYGAKYIVNPRVVYAPTVHSVLASRNGCSMVDGDIGRLYHTR